MNDSQNYHYHKPQRPHREHGSKKKKNDTLKLWRTIEIEKVRNRDGGGYRRWMDRKGKPRGKKRIFASWKDELVPGARFNNLHFSVLNWAKTMGWLIEARDGRRKFYKK